MKNLVFISILLISSISCKRNAGNNENLIQRYFQYFNKHDWQAMASLYTDTAEFKDPTLGPGIVKQTKQQTIKKYAELHQLFPDLKDTITGIYPSGDQHIIVEFTSTGPADNGSKLHLPICTIFTIVNHKITKDFTYYDNFEE